MRVIIFIPCSGRKQIAPESDMCAQHLTAGRIRNVAHEWGTRIKRSSPRETPDRIYSGRSFQEGQKAANCLNAELVVISAGYGLVREQDQISPYSLTVAPSNADSICHKVDSTEWSHQSWWRMLGAMTSVKTNLRSLLIESNPELILMALSVGYANLISEELSELTRSQKLRLRIFCARSNPYVPQELIPNIMPYDSRFDGPDSPIRGTKSDFSCRALHHFANNIQSGLLKGVNSDEDKSVLLGEMANWSVPDKPRRIRLSDEEIVAFISDAWHRVDQRSGLTLALLRESGYACEQGRFRELFRHVASIRNQNGESVNEK